MPTVLDLLGVPPPAEHLRRQPRPADDRRDASSGSTPTPRRCIRCITSDGATCARCDRAATSSSTRRGPSCTTSTRTRTRRRTSFAERQALGDRMIAQLRTMEGPFAKRRRRAGRRRRSRRARPARGARLCRLVRGERGGPRPPRGSQGQDRAVQPAGRRRSCKDRDGATTRRSSASPPEPRRREDPQVIDAWFMLGNETCSTESRGADRRLQPDSRLKPDYDLAVINLAQAYRRLGDDDAALAGFERYLKIDPKAPLRAIPDWRDLVGPRRPGDKPRSNSAGPWRSTRMSHLRRRAGSDRLATGGSRKRRTAVREALAPKPDVRLAHFNLALLAEQPGRCSRGRA